MKTAMEKSSHRQAASHKQAGRDVAALPDRRSASLSQSGVDSSPVVAAQRMQIENAFGEAIQRQTLKEEEEEPLQGKFVTLQRQSLEEEEEEPLQGKFIAFQRQTLEEEEPLQGKFATATVLQKEPSPNRTGLPDGLKAGIENLSGLPLDDVRVHYDSSKPAELQALAYTQGSDIHVAPGEERHLPHEAWHAVQQMQGRVKPTRQMKEGIPVNDEEELEREADEMGSKAAQRMSLITSKSAAGAGTIPQTTFHERRSITNIDRTPPLIQKKANMKTRRCNKRNLRKVLKMLRTAKTARGNDLATEGETEAHDKALHSGQHHGLRGLHLNDLIGDIEDKIGEYTELDKADSDELGVEKKAGRGSGARAIQLRTITGEIRTQKDSNNDFHIDVRGASNPPNLNIVNGGSVLVNGSAKRVLGGTDDFTRGHLVKASWDNNNDMERMTQWNTQVEEAAWTALEEEAQERAIEDSGNASDKKISSLTYTVTTEADEPDHGDTVLGADNGKITKPWLKNAVKSNAGNAVIVNGLRNELNRMVDTATMSIEGDSEIAKYKMPKETVGSVTSHAHDKLKIYDN